MGKIATLTGRCAMSMPYEEPNLNLENVKKTHEENLKRLEDLNAQLKDLYKMKEQLIQLQRQYDLWSFQEERRLALMRLTPIPPSIGFYFNPGYYYPYTPYPPTL